MSSTPAKNVPNSVLYTVWTRESTGRYVEGGPSQIWNTLRIPTNGASKDKRCARGTFCGRGYHRFLQSSQPCLKEKRWEKSPRRVDNPPVHFQQGITQHLPLCALYQLVILYTPLASVKVPSSTQTPSKVFSFSFRFTPLHGVICHLFNFTPWDRSSRVSFK